MKYTLLFLFAFVLSTSAFSQSKIVIDDRTDIMRTEIETILAKQLSDNELELTSTVDFKNKCDYYFVEIDQFSGTYYLTVRDCDNKSLGRKKLSGNITKVSYEDKAYMIRFAIMEILSSEGTEEEVEEVEEVLVSEEVVEEEAEYSSDIINGHYTRYLFSPSSFNLNQGELYYNNVYFFLHDMQYGITDNFSFGMGTSIIGMPFYLTPKYTFHIADRHTVSVGDMFMLGSWGLDFIGNLGYATYTYGDHYNNITLGLGYISTWGDDVFDENLAEPVFNVSGLGKLSTYMYFLTENYIVSNKREQWAYYEDWDNQIWFQEKYQQPQTTLIGFTGFRFINKRRDVISWQVGLGYFMNFKGEVPGKYTGPNWNTDNSDNNMLFVPMLGFAYKFGKMY